MPQPQIAPLEVPGKATVQHNVLIVAILASFVSILDGSVVNLALPAITQELGGGLSAQQWIVDAYLLTLGSLILVAGSLSDLFGRVKIMLWGLAGFAVASVLCGVASSDFFLILARGLQGVAGALLVPSSLALIVSTFSGKAQARAIGQWTAWTGVATIVAPLLGGVAVDYFSWRLVFFINLIPIAICLPILIKLYGTDSPQKGAKVDYLGAFLAVIGLGGVVFALIEQSSLGWQDPLVMVSGAIGVLALGGFIWHESRTQSPMMPLRFFGIRNFWVGNLTTFLVYGALGLGFFVLGLYLQQVIKLSASLTGIALLPTTLLMLLLSSWFGGLSGKYGPRFFMGWGPVIAGVGFLMQTGVSEDFNYWWQILPGLLVFGLGLAMTVAPLTAAILGSIDPASAGMGSAINNAIARISSLVTVALAGTLLGGMLTTEGVRTVLFVTAVLLVLGGVVSLLGIRNPNQSEPQ